MTAGSPREFLRRAWLTVLMTAKYQGRFPRRSVVRLYWRMAGEM